jgi:hypothetical protein
VGHLRASGYPVKEENVPDVTPIKRRYDVPARLEGCHTALVEGYVIEGHVPADLIDRLLKERPRAVGLAVPGMPAGSPGMDSPDQASEPYQVLLFDRSGKISVFATR